MSLRYKGGVISATPPTTTGGLSGTAKGVWTLQQQMQAQASSTWPLSPPTAVQVSRSLRLNVADTAYLTRTFGSAGNRKTWTWSGWVKRSEFPNTYYTLFEGSTSGTTDATYSEILFRSDWIQVSGYTTVWRRTNAVYRDPSAWYHIVLAFDTTQATASNRVKLYVNGVQETSFSISNDPTQNSDYGINQAAQHSLGSAGTGQYFGGYMTNIDFIDGQALTPSSFGQTNSTTGVWEPIQTVGYLTYGTNGFHLDFADNSGTTSTTLGKDTSGNSNNWTPNNFSVTAGTGNDSLVDTPTPYGTDTGAGGEVRGNYATLNPLNNALTLANGNLQWTGAATWKAAYSTIGVSSGKWYCELTCTAVSAQGTMFGISLSGTPNTGNYPGSASNSYGYYSFDGNKYNNTTNSSYGSSYTTNDVIGLALDMDAGTLTFYKNNVSQGTAYSSLSGTAFIGIAGYSTGDAGYLNFGQRAFAYTAPSGYKALVTQNLPTPTVIQGDDYFNTVLYTGTGSSLSVTGVGFQPDFTWIKSRSDAVGHIQVDVLRGATKYLQSNNTNAEGTDSNVVASFGTDGFTVGSDATTGASGYTYVAWNWKANGAGVSNTQGTITSTVSANTTSGFSVVTYTGNGTNGATIGHGLGATPSMIIVKNRTSAGYDWMVYQINLSANQNLKLDTTDASSSWASGYITSPSSTIFTCTTGSGNIYNVNKNTDNYVAYCFAPIAGFSAFGSYTGNGSTDGPFIYTGFRPAYVLVKRTDTAENWVIFDNKRDAYNLTSNVLLPNSSQAESSNTTSASMDLVSNGIKIRASTGINSGTWIYAAFAENPFKYALAR